MIAIQKGIRGGGIKWNEMNNRGSERGRMREGVEREEEGGKIEGKGWEGRGLWRRWTDVGEGVEREGRVGERVENKKVNIIKFVRITLHKG